MMKVMVWNVAGFSQGYDPTLDLVRCSRLTWTPCEILFYLFDVVELTSDI